MPFELEILDAARHGDPQARSEGPGPGLNRVKWDLRYESPRVVALRTVAPDNPHIWEEPRFRDADSRPITHWGSKPAEVGPIVAPGKLHGAPEGRRPVVHAAADRAAAIRTRPAQSRRHRAVGEDAAADPRRHQPRRPTPSTRSSGCASNSRWSRRCCARRRSTRRRAGADGRRRR